MAKGLLEVKTPRRELKFEIKSKLKEAIDKETEPKFSSREAQTQLLAAALSRVAGSAGSYALNRSMSKGIEKSVRTTRKLTSADIKKAIRLMGIKKEPLVILDSPLAGGSNAMVHGTGRLINWQILRELKEEDIKLHDKVKPKLEKLKGKDHYVMHIGKNMRNIGTVGHELGHIRLREALAEKLGKWPAKVVGLTRALSVIGGLPSFKDTPITKKETALKTLSYAPILADEYIASHLSKKRMKGIKKENKKLLNTAFGTYALDASNPIRQKLAYELLKNLGK